MKKLFAAIFALSSSAAMGADMSMPAPLPPPAYMPAPAPLYSWSGFYIGGNGGGTWAHSSSTASIAGGPLGGLSASGSSTGSAALGGGQIGQIFNMTDLSSGSRAISIGLASAIIKRSLAVQDVAERSKQA